MSATPNPATWRSDGSGRDLIHVQRGACREDEPIARLMDEPNATEPREGVVRVFRRDVFAGPVPDKLVHGPRPLIVRVDEPGHHAPVVHVVRLYCWVRLLLHRKVLPFGATPPAVTAVRGHFDREAPNLSAPNEPCQRVFATRFAGPS